MPTRRVLARHEPVTDWTRLRDIAFDRARELNEGGSPCPERLCRDEASRELVLQAWMFCEDPNWMWWLLEPQDKLVRVELIVQLMMGVNVTLRPDLMMAPRLYLLGDLTLPALRQRESELYTGGPNVHGITDLDSRGRAVFYEIKSGLLSLYQVATLPPDVRSTRMSPMHHLQNGLVLSFAMVGAPFYNNPQQAANKKLCDLARDTLPRSYLLLRK